MPGAETSSAKLINPRWKLDVTQTTPRKPHTSPQGKYTQRGGTTSVGSSAHQRRTRREKHEAQQRHE